jgi:hypothetical protein
MMRRLAVAVAFAGVLTIATESRADSVEVKYFGDTSLDGFNCENISHSSFVNRIATMPQKAEC